MMNAAEQLVARLLDHKVSVVFGLPGEENLAVTEALAASTIDFVLVRHEQHAAFMAAAHGRLTGRPGVCLSTLGPGATNLLTGLAHAELGGMPIVAITGQKSVRNNEEGSFQVIDVEATARPVTRWTQSLTDPNDVAAAVDQALRQSLDGRPGATLLELPEDIAGQKVDQPVQQPPPPRPVQHAGSDDVEATAQLIADAKQPVVLIGGGAASASVAAAATDFASRSGIGVVTTQMAKGVVPESHPLSMTTLGIHRPDYAHLSILPADLVLAVGYQPVEHPPLAWNPAEDKSIVHLDRAEPRVERGYQPLQHLAGDIADTLTALADRLDSRPTGDAVARGTTIRTLLDNEGDEYSFPPSPVDVVRAVRDVLDDEDIVALDNGAYKIWFARHYRAEHVNTVLLDNALATMGAGLATAMEASRLRPDRRVVAVCGDGGFLMNVQDLETAVRLELNLAILVVRDDAYGFIGWHQEEKDRPRDLVTLSNPDFVLLARAFGASGLRVDEDNSLRDVLTVARNEPGVSVVDCPIDYSMNELLSSDSYQVAQAHFRRTTEE